MKKLLLSMLAACAVVGASAAVTDLKGVWNVSQECAADTMLWNAPVAVDAAGNLYGAGAFDKEFAPAGTTLAPIGTSAFIGKWDVNGGIKWAVAITGAATITAIDVDAAGNVYVAGVYADEITFGTTSGEPIVKEGQMVDGAPTSELNSSFIAKYDAEGAVKAVETFIPEAFAALEGLAYFEDGDIFFHINHLKEVDGTVYASAVYTGVTTKFEATFEGTYDDALGWGFMFVPLKSVAVLSMKDDLTTCDPVVTYGPTEPQAADAETSFEFQATSVAFDVDGETVYAVFSGSGPLTAQTSVNQKKTEVGQQEYDYAFAAIKDRKFEQFATVKCPEAGASVNDIPSNVFVNGDAIIVPGHESVAENYGSENETISNQIFLFKGSKSSLDKLEKATFNFTEGNVNYYDLSASAITPDGALLLSALGYYTDKVEGEGGHSMGDFASKSQAYALIGGQAFPVPNSGLSYGIATSGSYAALSQIGWGGVSYTLFNDPTGVEDIVVDSNAAVEYFNLQGVRVSNPENGLYIRRQGAKASKVLVK